MPQLSHRKKLVAVTIVVGAVVVAASIYAIINYPSHSNTQAPQLNYTELEYGTRTSTVPNGWGLATSFPCTACATLNFTLNASGGVTTGMFGVKLMNVAGGLITGWVAILWNAGGTAPLAGYSNVSGTWKWVAAGGFTLPVVVQNDYGLTVISTTLAGSGDTFGISGGNCNSGVYINGPTTVACTF
jgi:hypothetical protein